MAHTLEYERAIFSYANADSILRRMVVIHNYFEQQVSLRWKETLYYDCRKGWHQRLFLDCIDQAELEFFTLKNPYDQVRRKIAEVYLFENYRLMEMQNTYTESMKPIASLVFLRVEHKLSHAIFLSDAVIYSLLKDLKNRFPQVADNAKIEFPAVK